MSLGTWRIARIFVFLIRSSMPGRTATFTVTLLTLTTRYQPKSVSIRQPGVKVSKSSGGGVQPHSFSSASAVVGQISVSAMRFNSNHIRSARPGWTGHRRSAVCGSMSPRQFATRKFIVFGFPPYQPGGSATSTMRRIV